MTCDSWDSPGNENKNAISYSVAFSVDIFIRNENIISEKRKTKTSLMCRVSL